jgi:hypothetical protein
VVLDALHKYRFYFRISHGKKGLRPSPIPGCVKRFCFDGVDGRPRPDSRHCGLFPVGMCGAAGAARELDLNGEAVFESEGLFVGHLVCSGWCVYGLSVITSIRHVNTYLRQYVN